jgi:hypothetical protein
VDRALKIPLTGLRVYLSEASETIREGHKDAPDEIIVGYACAMCVGFLGTYEHDVIALRRQIDAFDEVQNPDSERVEGPQE